MASLTAVLTCRLAWAVARPRTEPAMLFAPLSHMLKNGFFFNHGLRTRCFLLLKTSRSLEVIRHPSRYACAGGLPAKRIVTARRVPGFGTVLTTSQCYVPPSPSAQRTTYRPSPHDRRPDSAGNLHDSNFAKDAEARALPALGALAGVTMASDPESAQRQRLRGNFGLMVVWAVVGCVLGVLLTATFSAAGFGSGFIRSASSEVAVMIAAYLIIGIIVLSGIVKAFKEPLPDELGEGSHVPSTEAKPGHLITRHVLRKQEEARAAVEVDHL